MELIRGVLENTDAFDMMRLREEVKSPDAVDLIGWACTYDHADVTRLRMHVARNIDDMYRPKRKELLDEFVVAAAPRSC